MFPRLPLRRSTRTRLLRTALLLLTLFLLLDALTLSSLRRAIPPLVPSPPSPPRPPYPGPPILLASTHWNNAAILSSNWTSSLLALASYLGPRNLYVSIVESGSWDESGGLLRDLDRELGAMGVGRRVLTGGRSHKEEMERPIGVGWVDTSGFRKGGGGGGRELRRVPYLAGVRNRVMEVLGEGVRGRVVGRGVREEVVEKGERMKGKGELKRKPKVESKEVAKGREKEVTKAEDTGEDQWDWSKLGKVVWVNDVVFTVDDILNLINTRDGDYAAACSMDYSKPPAYYDTFALRDIEGYEAVTSTFPYFRSRISRRAILAGQPVPVQSCWNGMVAFDPSPFTSLDPLSFRGIPDSLASLHLEASECCLIHADNPLTPSKGVWLNPSVRVGYSPAAYDAVHANHPQSDKNGRGGAAWPSFGDAWAGVWKNRIARWGSSEWFKRRRVRGRVRQWGKEGDGARFEAGEVCLINEMQVLVENGWAHV
ncbi:MAG: hypothetical protein HETSPECPRED_010394 [Heterodermia speciosa]|uniref:Glycosyltransferase family 69 protein n=1 Tax=Heterodermia speciosa TaxID=116794 RepID=A0A8H3G6A6_9LECA|nr:MAG: hypothetical protein HETSPECPRED_010394 [Heterodermia speciosa]